MTVAWNMIRTGSSSYIEVSIQSYFITKCNCDSTPAAYCCLFYHMLHKHKIIESFTIVFVRSVMLSDKVDRCDGYVRLSSLLLGLFYQHLPSQELNTSAAPHNVCESYKQNINFHAKCNGWYLQLRQSFLLLCWLFTFTDSLRVAE